MFICVLGEAATQRGRDAAGQCPREGRAARRGGGLIPAREREQEKAGEASQPPCIPRGQQGGWESGTGRVARLPGQRGSRGPGERSAGGMRGCRAQPGSSGKHPTPEASVVPHLSPMWGGHLCGHGPGPSPSPGVDLCSPWPLTCLLPSVYPFPQKRDPASSALSQYGLATAGPSSLPRLGVLAQPGCPGHRTPTEAQRVKHEALLAEARPHPRREPSLDPDR